MSKKRTKNQKIHAKKHYSVTPTRSFSTVENHQITEKKEVPLDITSLYMYDPKYLKQDLLKTLLFSSIILAIQIAIYTWLK